MIRHDGEYRIFMIQHRWKRSFWKEYPQRKEWDYSNLGEFGSPPGFTASDPCWQQTGVMGTFDPLKALRGLRWIETSRTYVAGHARKPEHLTDYDFRVVMVCLSQATNVCSPDALRQLAKGIIITDPREVTMPKATPKARKKKVLVYTIEYQVAIEEGNIEQVLDTLRENGAAQVTDARVEEVVP